MELPTKTVCLPNANADFTESRVLLELVFNFSQQGHALVLGWSTNYNSKTFTFSYIPAMVNSSFTKRERYPVSPYIMVAGHMHA